MNTFNLKKYLKMSDNNDVTMNFESKKFKSYEMQPLTEDEINDFMDKAVEKYNRENSRDIFEDDY
ncbi:hypothetical protein H5A40_00905 [Pectobacterium brasiliense]|uniref:hypothetical protein n=1 Tax=Pectobacterium brasiliense TaxID=180957 RepID=UPI0019698DE2|nr:hypothetical protein [Pectobacterium brasiliense]QSD35766.1 hypothetical protein H5A40_00905 [Pectobacterium brasiliense]